MASQCVDVLGRGDYSMLPSGRWISSLWFLPHCDVSVREDALATRYIARFATDCGECTGVF